MSFSLGKREVPGSQPQRLGKPKVQVPGGRGASPTLGSATRVFGLDQACKPQATASGPTTLHL